MDSNYLRNILSVEESSVIQRKDLDNQLTSQFPGVYASDQIACPISLIADKQIYYKTQLVKASPMHHSNLVGNGNTIPIISGENAWQAKENTNQMIGGQISFNSHFNSEQWIQDCSDTSGQDTVIQDGCENGENAGSYKLMNNFICSDLHLSDNASSGNQSTVSSVAELLSHTTE